MKNTMTFVLMVLLATGGLPAVAASTPIVPQSPVITYGLVRDEYGEPLTKKSNASLSLVRSDARDGRVYAACTIGDSGLAGMNYRISLEIDSGGPRRTCAVTSGSEMFIKPTGGITNDLSPVATFVTPAPGTKQRLDYSIGSDSDSDGLPDAWEEWVLDEAGHDSSPEAIAAFFPNDDADGDGMTNLQEFLAGTDPFLATDLFKIESLKREPESNRVKLVFLTSATRVYRVLMTESLNSSVWTPVATADTATGDLVYTRYSGTGRRMVVYIDARLDSMFFRVAAD